jgi:hypothetical protein
MIFGINGILGENTKIILQKVHPQRTGFIQYRAVAGANTRNVIFYFLGAKIRSGTMIWRGSRQLPFFAQMMALGTMVELRKQAKIADSLILSLRN